MFFRFLLIALAFFLLIRIIRGIISYLFPSTKSQDSPQVGSTSQKSKPKEYTDVQDAKFKDVEKP